MIYERAIKKKFEDTKRGIGSHKSMKDRRYNGQKKRTNELQKLHRKLKIE